MTWFEFMRWQKQDAVLFSNALWEVKNTEVSNPLWETSEGMWMILIQISHITCKGLFCIFVCGARCVFRSNTVCPSIGDMRPYLSKWKSRRILGGWRLQATEESSPAANGSLLPLGTVRCYFYDYVISDCPMSTTMFPAPRRNCACRLTPALLIRTSSWLLSTAW